MAKAKSRESRSPGARRRPGSARPRSANLDHVIHTRVSSEALGMLEQKAEASTMSIATIVRQLVYRGLGIMHPHHDPSEET